MPKEPRDAGVGIRRQYPSHGVAGALHWCEGRGGLENWRAACLCWGGEEGMGRGGREFDCSLLSGLDHACLAGLLWRSPEQGYLPRTLGQPSLAACLDLQESDRGRHIGGAIHDLVDMTRPCSWRLLLRFVGRELLAVLFFFFFFVGTDF